MILAKPEILAAHRRGDLTIEPFNERLVSNSSVDVTLGRWYWVEKPQNYDSFRVVNPFDEKSVRDTWMGPYEAKPHPGLPGVKAGTPCIVIQPGENLLCSTEQFIGSNDLMHTTMMKARSSMGRNQITVCRCAGLGDIGYANRWTMEISNNGKRPFLLVTGRRIAQIIFFCTSGLDSEEQTYNTTGKYQQGTRRGMTAEELEARWKPEDMLPKMWLDREAFDV